MDKFEYTYTDYGKDGRISVEGPVVNILVGILITLVIDRFGHKLKERSREVD